MLTPQRLLAGLTVAVLTLGSPAVSAGEPDASPLDHLLFQLNQSRGIAGPPASSASVRRVDDPRAAAVAERLRQVDLPFLARAAAPPAPAPAAAAPVPAAGEPRQRAALQRLAAVVGPQLEVHLRPENGTIRQIRGGVLGRAEEGVAKADPRARQEVTARSFLRNHADLLRVREPDRELILETHEPDGRGGRHLRFSQRLGDLPVWPASMSLHLDARGDVVLLDGGYVPTPEGVEVEPQVLAADAVLRAKASVPGGMRGEAGEPDLIVFAPLGEAPRLAWRLALNVGLVQAWRFIVDARDGRILRRSNRILDAAVPGRGIDLEGISRNLSVWQANNNHFLIDASKPMFRQGSDPVQKPEGAITIADARLKKVNELKGSDIFLITSGNPAQWDIPDGVSAAYNFSQTYDYFLADHQRNSLDGQGGNITAVVRIGEYANASWNGNLKIMLFGNVEPYAGALDVVGHELTHGLTESSAGLVYENQSGALNESFSDIFGEMVEAHVVGQPDWKMGSKLSKHLRDLVNPGSIIIPGLNRPYPSKMSEFVQLPNTDEADHGGVHINSSIPNHCFWLLAEGLPGAIGRSDAARIFYRCLTQHLQAQSQFVDTRLGCLAAAEALFGAGSTQVRKVAEAFDAVEIFAAPETPAPTPVPVVQGPDSALFIAVNPFSFFGEPNLYRRESAQGDSEFGSTFSQSIKISRPAVTGDGSITLYVNTQADICLAETANAFTTTCLGFSGFVHAVALSPDGRLGAFVFLDPQTQQPDNRISVLDLANPNAQPRTYELLAPTVDGAPVDGVLYADAMTFSTDSEVLIYDALSQLRFGAGPTVHRWSISALNLATAKTSIVVPPIEGLDTGNPSMGRAGNRFLTFDAVVEGTQNSAIVVLDLFSGTAVQMDLVQGFPNYLGLGYPTFSGDESALIYAQQDPQAPTSGYSIVRLPLGPDRLSATGNPTVWVEDAFLGVVYRRGAFTGNNSLPSVTLTDPSAGAPLPPGTTVTLQATASDADGAVVRVEFFDGNLRLGEDASAPFALSWTPTATGGHRLIARATDNLGGVADSAAVNITVGTPPVARPTLSIQRLANGVMRLSLAGTPGDYIVQQSTDLRQWTDIHPVTLGADGLGSVDNGGGPANERAVFYRARRP